MPGYLTTHVLDTARGCPAAGMAIDLYRLEADTRHHLARALTNADGRTDAPILPEQSFAIGDYELLFRAGAYLRTQSSEAGFLENIPIRFRMTEASHYHVPLLLSPFGYSTYRGS